MSEVGAARAFDVVTFSGDGQLWTGALRVASTWG